MVAAPCVTTALFPPASNFGGSSWTIADILWSCSQSLPGEARHRGGDQPHCAVLDWVRGPTRKGRSSFSSYGGDQQAYLDEKAAQKSVSVLESGLMYKASGFIPSCSAGLLLGLSSSQRHHCQLTVHTGS